MKIKIPPHTGVLNDVYAQQLTQVLKNIQASPILNGVLVEDIEVGATSTKISHRLGRIPKGFIVVSSSADVRIYRDPTQIYTTQFMYLIGSSAETVSLWVF